MAICKNCGVDLGEGNERCPLCDPSEDSAGRVASPADLFRLSRIQNAKHLYEIIMLLLVSGVIITIAIDAAFGKGMGWSLLTTTCIGYLTALVSGFWFLRKKPYWMISATTLFTLLFLWFMDLLTGETEWFLPMACPLVISAAILTAAVVYLNSFSRYRGLNLLATILVAVALFVLVTEYLTDRLISSEFTPSWSLVAAASLVIIAMIFIFIHYRLKRGHSLGRMFHI
ncbi:MAG: DUF6320 domain-containing protein [Bacteroidales bacterium]|jgi:hypothetical protein|nr:DUF6320 domain-containing protein [Bacteroidales bacterium]